MTDGLLLIDKEPRITSHDAVDIVRRATRIRKIGHTGTLDPLATGLLVLCIGRATRLQAYLMKMEKTYEGTIQFGWATDTYDAEGPRPAGALEASVEGFDFESVLPRFRGAIEQMPPAYSAKKIQGVRSYELARKGETAVLEAKQVQIHEFDILRVDGSRAGFRVRSSAGTYVRSLANDLGAAIGIPAHLGSLRRTAIGRFEVSRAIESSRVRTSSRDDVFAAPHFTPMHEIDLSLESVLVDRMQEAKLLQGQSIILRVDIAGLKQRDLVSISSVANEMIAIAEVTEVLREGGGPVVLQPKVVLKV
jgi:tRNA pseudouridine55 synthase